MNDTAELFAMAGVWVVIAALIARAVPFTSRWGKPLMFAALVAILFWELPVGYSHFRRLCNEETKLQVLEKIPPQDSICLEHLNEGFVVHLKKIGFSKIEIIGQNPASQHYLNNPTFKGVLSFSDRGKITSPYCLVTRVNIAVAWDITRADTLIINSQNDRIVARQSQFRWAGLWWQRSASPLLGVGGRCAGDQETPINAFKNGVT
jgi:hypothetical protein